MKALDHTLLGHFLYIALDASLTHVKGKPHGCCLNGVAVPTSSPCKTILVEPKSLSLAE